MSRRGIDLSVYLVIGPDDCGSRPPASVVAAAVAGGATLVQLRCKAAAHGDFLALAREIKAVLAGTGVPLIINDAVEVAVAVGAEGVHVGQGDMSPAEVRRRVGPDMIVGLSITGEDEVGMLDPSVVSYAGVGPVFATRSKADAGPPLGLAGLGAIRARLSVPVVAIGGIGLDNAGAVIGTGADGVAVVSVVCAAPDPRLATEALARTVTLSRSRG
ncbi:MAG TPA: thiamine phosphate synthase [Azospirillaceae bacterium]|nr:thiamine phosphate synthase [Azospirillaceae bacterium]